MGIFDYTVYGKVTDEKGRGIAGVSVTDGRIVVETDKDGDFRIVPWHKCHFIYITLPSGYYTDDFFIPYEKDKKEYNFVLSQTDKTYPSFIQISDSEIGKDGTGEWLDFVRNAIKKEDPAFLIHTGDICYEDGLKRHLKDMNTGTMGCPVHYVIGNHDYVAGKFGEELYESIYGPVWYSFEVGNVHFAVTPIQNGDYPSCYSDSDRWKWLENDLTFMGKDKKLVIFNHSNSPEKDFDLSCGMHRLDLKKHNCIAWVFGHYHYNCVYEEDGILNISTARPDVGGIDSSAAGMRLIDINEEGKINTRMIYYAESEKTQEEVWKTGLPGHGLYCDTLYEDGFIYTATAGDDWPQDCGIFCLDAKTGKIIWKYKTENSVKNNIVLYKDSVIAMDTIGNVYSVRKEDGALIWKNSLELWYFGLGTSSAITLSDDTVYVGNGADIYALNAGNGNIQLFTQRDCGCNSPAGFVIKDNLLLVSSQWDALLGIDTLSGNELWKNADDDIRFRSSTPVFIDDDTVLTAECNAVMIVDAKSGRITDKINLDDFAFASCGQPAYKDGIAYIPTTNKGIIAFDVENKKVLWNCDTEESKVFTPPYVGKGSHTVESSPVIDGDKIYFGANDGYIYAADLNTGAVVKKYNAGSGVLGKVALADDKIFALTFDGLLVCFNK